MLFCHPNKKELLQILLVLAPFATFGYENHGGLWCARTCCQWLLQSWGKTLWGALSWLGELKATCSDGSKNLLVKRTNEQKLKSLEGFSFWSKCFEQPPWVGSNPSGWATSSCPKNTQTLESWRAFLNPTITNPQPPSVFSTKRPPTTGSAAGTVFTASPAGWGWRVPAASWLRWSWRCGSARSAEAEWGSRGTAGVQWVEAASVWGLDWGVGLRRFGGL